MLHLGTIIRFSPIAKMLLLAMNLLFIDNDDMHILSAEQFTTGEMADIFERADYFQEKLRDHSGRRELAELHKGEQVASVFYEPSTRTKASFELAAIKLGMNVFETENAGEFSSVSKGETIEDTVRVLGSYGLSAIVLRTKEEGLVARAASSSRVPIINGGDGKGEHPTQALLDAYTIDEAYGRLENLRVVMGGDLRRGRTVRSLSKILAKFPGNHITYVSIPEFQIGNDIKQFLDYHGTSYSETSDMYEPLHDADVVYWTRLQSERSESGEAPGSDKLPPSHFVIDEVALEAMNQNAIIMHPLPRVDEIHQSVDEDPRAFYFEQAENGLYLRMALLDQAAASRR